MLKRKLSPATLVFQEIDFQETKDFPAECFLDQQPSLTESELTEKSSRKWFPSAEFPVPNNRQPYSRTVQVMSVVRAGFFRLGITRDGINVFRCLKAETSATSYGEHFPPLV